MNLYQLNCYFGMSLMLQLTNMSRRMGHSNGQPSHNSDKFKPQAPMFTCEQHATGNRQPDKGPGRQSDDYLRNRMGSSIKDVHTFLGIFD